MKKIIVLFLLLASVPLISLESCSKTAYYDATVVADGDENVDGCGWLLSIDGVLYYPVGLAENDRVDGKQITIQYTIGALPHVCVNNISYSVATITKYLN